MGWGSWHEGLCSVWLCSGVFDQLWSAGEERRGELSEPGISHSNRPGEVMALPIQLNTIQHEMVLLEEVKIIHWLDLLVLALYSSGKATSYRKLQTFRQRKD